MGRSIFVSDSTLDSLPSWKKKWFYVYLEGADWNDYFFSDFSRAEDGAISYLKLGVKEEAAIRVLTRDNLHHSSMLISEASLQEHDLSDLGSKGMPLFIFPISFF